MSQGQVGESDPVVQHQDFRKGKMIQAWPTHSDSKHKDVGKPKQKGIGCRDNGWEYSGAGVRREAGFAVSAHAETDF
jgi:hypothetical protein